MIMYGVIKAVTGTTPGPASGITYTIAVIQPDGGVVNYENCVNYNRPFGSGLDIRAARVGSRVLVIDNKQTLDFLVFGEEPDYGPCPGTQGVTVVTPEELRLIETVGSTAEATNTGNEGVPGGGDQP